MTIMDLRKGASRLDAGARRVDVIIDTHWASAFEQKRGRVTERRAQMRDWLAENYAKVREVAARIGETAVVTPDADPGRSAVLVDVIHLDDVAVGSALRDTLIFTGWGSRNLASPAFASRQYRKQALDLFGQRFLEAYDDGREPMYVAHPGIIRPEHRRLLRHLQGAGWNVSLSPYGNHLRNETLRLSFTQYASCANYVDEQAAGRFAGPEAEGFTAVASEPWEQFHSLLISDPALFDALLEGLLIDDEWILTASDQGEALDRPALRVLFSDRATSERFRADHLSTDATR